jgi:MoaA/NifB/PqqE/SkfB family radical SAM enzyme
MAHPTTAVPRPLFGATRQLADAAIGLDLLRIGLRARRELGLSLSGLARFLRAQLALAGGLSQHKYMRFGRRLFVDLYSPHWPSRSFERMMTAYAAGGEFVAYAILAVTRRCPFRCEHCYAAHTLGRHDALAPEKLLELTRGLLRIGVGVLSFEGGEPLLRFDDLLPLLRECRGRASPYLATTGAGLTAARARALADAGLVGVQISLDHHDRARHNAFRRNPRAFDIACEAVGLFRQAGVFPVLAVCATPELVASGGLYRYLELARELGAGMIQVLDPMPAGNYLEGRTGEQVLDAASIETLKRFHVEANTSRRFRGYPAVTVRAHVEDDCRYGCGMGGTQHFYIDACGNVSPCVYLAAALGNVLEEELETIFARMRRLFPRPLGGFCPVYEAAPAIAARTRGGEPLPLRGESALAVLEPLSRRGLPAIFARVRRSR